MYLKTLFIVTLIGYAVGQSCSTQENSDIDLSNIGSKNNTQASQCCNLCSAMAGCKGYTWNSYQSGTCWFKSGAGPIISNPGVTAGSLADGSSAAFSVIAFATAENDVGHISFVNEANEWFPQAAQEHNFTFTSTTNWNLLNDAELAKYDVVIFLDTRPEGASQRTAFEKYMRNGGGWMGFHFSAFALTPSTYPQNWNWYHREFLGSDQYGSNTWKPTPAFLKVENAGHPATAGLPVVFETAANEWYRWDGDLVGNPDIDILLSIDDSSFPLGTGPNEWEIWYDGYYPVVWTNKNYNMIYMNMGHNDIDYSNGNAPLSFTFKNELQNQMVINSLRWMSGNKK